MTCAAPQSLSVAVDVAAVIDIEHVDGAGPVIDAVADPVLATPSPPLPFERRSQRRSYSAGIVGERAEDELDARRRGRLWQVLAKATSSSSGHDDPEAHR